MNTAKVADMLVAGKLKDQVDGSVVGRLLVQQAFYVDGNWYMVSVQAVELDDIQSYFGNEERCENRVPLSELGRRV